MHKRHVLNPRLEPMEIRLVPSTLGIHAPASQVVAARVARLEAHGARNTTTHGSKPDAAQRNHHVSHPHPTQPASSTSNPQNTNIFSKFFKSVFGGL